MWIHNQWTIMHCQYVSKLCLCLLYFCSQNRRSSRYSFYIFLFMLFNVFNNTETSMINSGYLKCLGLIVIELNLKRYQSSGFPLLLRSVYCTLQFAMSSHVPLSKCFIWVALNRRLGVMFWLRTYNSMSMSTFSLSPFRTLFMSSSHQSSLRLSLLGK